MAAPPPPAPPTSSRDCPTHHFHIDRLSFSVIAGSGKTTLLNHILTANHGKKIAVIENEVRPEPTIGRHGRMACPSSTDHVPEQDP